MWRRLLGVLFALGVCTSARADTDTARHLLSGVHAFQEGRYEEALVELRVVARAPDAPADLAFYLGPTLYKLARYREALAVFVTSKATRDELSDFYLGETYYQLKMYRKARAVFVALRARSLGPVLDAAAVRYVDAVDDAYRSPVAPAAVDVYVAQAGELVASDALLAGELLDEARLVEALLRARYRHHEIIAALGAAWNAAGRPQSVVDVLASEPALSPESSWELARGYLAIGDPTHARPLLEAVARGAGPHRGDAVNLLAHPP